MRAQHLFSYEKSQKTGACRHCADNKVREIVDVRLIYARYASGVLLQFEVRAGNENAEHENQQNIIESIHEFAAVGPDVEVHDHNHDPARQVN